MQRETEQTNEQLANKRRRVSHEPADYATAPAPVLSLSPGGGEEENDDNFGIVIELDEIPRLVMVDILGSNDEYIVGKALKDLANLLKCSPQQEATKNRQQAIEVGAMTAIVSTVRKWRSVEFIQVQGWRCAANIMASDFQDVKKTFVRVGGVEEFLIAWKRFPNSEILHVAGIASLTNFLCTEDADMQKQVATRFAKDLNGVQVLLQAMKTFPDCLVLQKRCCLAFYNMCVISKDLVPLVEKSGAISTVGIAIDKYPEDEELRTQGGNFMKLMFP